MLGNPKTKSYPVLPLRDVVVFPHMIVPLFVGRKKSVKALEYVMQQDKQVVLVTQKTPSENEPNADELYSVGVIGTVLQLLKLPDGTVKVLVEGGQRVRISHYKDDQGYMEADVVPLKEEGSTASEEDLEATARTVTAQFENYVKLNKKVPPEVIVAVNQIEEPSKMADTVATHLVLKIEQKQEILEIANPAKRLEVLYGLMDSEMGVMQVEKRIRGRVKKQMEKTQREFYLNEQMKAIQKELGENNAEGPMGEELEELKGQVENAKMPKDAKERADKELKKLSMMSPMAAEATILRNYIDWLVSLPWHKKTRVSKDIRKAQKILDRDHYGLDKVKERILEYLAVQQRSKIVKGPILCLVGPPGVGKTSLGKSIAKATNRKFVRMALGGVRDESEIRGHRRTYLGALPGKIIQGMKRAEVVNPLFLLDEVDKMGHDHRGDPSSALLEVLDPEQNGTFQDHYIELDYDLSKTMFVCTANDLSNMSRPLLDRMEIIQISGYTEEEKMQIVKRHLLKKQIKEAGLKTNEFSISDAALKNLIRHYTKEAGVRKLEREIANLCRKAIKEILMKDSKSAVAITPRNLEKYAGVKKFRFRQLEDDHRVGVVNGLAYTQMGGDILSIEAVVMPGKDGKVSTTGNLKDVMKESITVAEMLIKSRAAGYGIDYDTLKEQQVHVHVPEGATPKDGPSAGAAMVTAIMSALTGIPVRRDIAMTGEVNLRGRVTAIGGLKEKLLGALRAGSTTVLIPEDNAKDLADIPANVKKGLEIIAVSRIEEVLNYALLEMPEPIVMDSDKESDAIMPKTPEKQGKDVIHH